MSNTYTYHDDEPLTPSELFFHIAVYQTCKQLGISDVLGAAAVISGQPVIPVPGKLGGATQGTSIVSIASRKLIRARLKSRVPTLTMHPLKPWELKIAMTRSLGAVVGRAVPFVGWIVLGYDVGVIVHNSVIQYNSLVKPEDQIF